MLWNKFSKIKSIILSNIIKKLLHNLEFVHPWIPFISNIVLKIQQPV